MSFLITIFSLALNSFLFTSCSKPQPQTPSLHSFNDHQLITASIRNTNDLQLEIVNTPQSISQGLSGRDELGADGMLFVFDQPIIPQFWMKEMKFDLDIIWIFDQKIIEITQSVSAPVLGVSLSELPIYSPKQSVDMVLEVEAGRVVEWQLSLGDLIFIK